MVDRPSIIGSIPRIRGDVSFNLCQQGLDLRGVIFRSRRQRLGDDLLGMGIDTQMQFALGTSLCPSMLTQLPFSFAEDLQPTAVNNPVYRLFF